MLFTNKTLEYNNLKIKPKAHSAKITFQSEKEVNAFSL
jgi:hypothetical protein